MAITAAFSQIRELDGQRYGIGYAVEHDLASTTRVYAGNMVAQDVSGKVVMATDAANLQVLGNCQSTVCSTAGSADYGTSVAVRASIFRYFNSANTALTVLDIGAPCFVEDAQTVSGIATSAHHVAAGLVFDVETEDGCDYVWVDQCPLSVGLSGYRVGV